MIVERFTRLGMLYWIWEYSERRLQSTYGVEWCKSNASMGGGGDNTYICKGTMTTIRLSIHSTSSRDMTLEYSMYYRQLWGDYDVFNIDRAASLATPSSGLLFVRTKDAILYLSSTFYYLLCTPYVLCTTYVMSS